MTKAQECVNYFNENIDDFKDPNNGNLSWFLFKVGNEIASDCYEGSKKSITVFEFADESIAEIDEKTLTAKVVK